MPHRYIPLKLPSFGHLPKDVCLKIVIEGAAPENCECNPTLLKFVRVDGSVYGKERIVDGAREFQILDPRHSLNMPQ